MTAVDWSAITDFATAAFCLFIAGLLLSRPKQTGSASWYWCLAMLLLGLGAFLAAIDHGFIQQRKILPFVNSVTRVSWALVGCSTAAVLMATARQFFPRWRWAMPLALLQLVLFLIAVSIGTEYAIVSVNALPEFLLMLGCSIAGLRSGRGSPEMAGGFLLLIGASVVQAMGVDLFTPIDHNGLYHLISMIGIGLFYFAGRKLATSVILGRERVEATARP